MMEKFIRYGAISLIALMIWLYAEGATRRQHTVSVMVRLVPPANQKLLIVPQTVPVSLTVRCATSQIKQVDDLEKTPLEIEVSPANVLLVMENLIAAHDRVNSLGITIERLDPGTVEVKVERLEDKELRIELVMPADLELVGPATFSRETVKVTLPASYATQAETFKMQARIDANALAGVLPGVTADRTIAVTLPSQMANWPNVSFAPNSVQVSFVVKKKEDEFVVSLVPVLLNISPAQARQYDIEIDSESQVLRDLKLKGPSDAIARIRQGGFKVEAWLRLLPEELENGIQAKLPELRLPPGVTPESTVPVINLTIKPRPAG